MSSGVRFIKMEVNISLITTGLRHVVPEPDVARDRIQQTPTETGQNMVS